MSATSAPRKTARSRVQARAGFSRTGAARGLAGRRVDTDFPAAARAVIIVLIVIARPVGNARKIDSDADKAANRAELQHHRRDKQDRYIEIQVAERRHHQEKPDSADQQAACEAGNQVSQETADNRAFFVA